MFRTLGAPLAQRFGIRNGGPARSQQHQPVTRFIVQGAVWGIPGSGEVKNVQARRYSTDYQGLNH
ncbi:hypothetical protein AK972_2216 [Pseudomonas yamanorum]|jgi:hypothetical protein|nr:hypothetical protein AK972_2216 [Pseudomonas yamanorum]